MTQKAAASTQYGDLRGTIAIDGHSGLRVDELIQTAQVPKGYHPIAIRIYGFATKDDSPSVKAKLLCVDVEQTGKSPDEIRKFGRQNGELHTFEFDAEIDLAAIAPLIKRYDIVLTSKLVRDSEVRIQPIQD